MRYTSLASTEVSSTTPLRTSSTQLPQVHQPCLEEQIACFGMYGVRWDGERPTGVKSPPVTRRKSQTRRVQCLNTAQHSELPRHQEKPHTSLQQLQQASDRATNPAWLSPNCSKSISLYKERKALHKHRHLQTFFLPHKVLSPPLSFAFRVSVPLLFNTARKLIN